MSGGTKLVGRKKLIKYSINITEDSKGELEDLAIDLNMSRNASINRAIHVLSIIRKLAGDTGTVVITYPDKPDVVVIL